MGQAASVALPLMSQGLALAQSRNRDRGIEDQQRAARTDALRQALGSAREATALEQRRGRELARLANRGGNLRGSASRVAQLDSRAAADLEAVDLDRQASRQAADGRLRGLNRRRRTQRFEGLLEQVRMGADNWPGPFNGGTPQ